MKPSSFLFVDIGNSRVKWTVAEISDREPKPSIMGDMLTTQATPVRIQNLAKKFPRHFLVLSSVVPRLVPIFSRAFARRCHLVTSESPALGLRFDYPNPAEIGADRLAAAVAVQAEALWPVIIVSCGTATAFTVLDNKGRLCGGVIAPGLQAQLASLLGATAQLPDIALRPTGDVLARSTGDAIRAGVVLNFQGGVKEILQRLVKALPGKKKPRIVLTGGNAHYLADSLDLPHTLRPLLVFEGLRMIGTRAFLEE